jgi:hypothetical protein
LAILFPPRLICPSGHRSRYMQSNRQTSPPVRPSASRSIYDTSAPARSALHPQLKSAALNYSTPVENFNTCAVKFYWFTPVPSRERRKGGSGRDEIAAHARRAATVRAAAPLATKYRYCQNVRRRGARRGDRNRTYFLPSEGAISGLVGWIFFDFFKVFLAMWYSLT